MHTYSLFYVTCADIAEARDIARALLNERLIACANILPHMLSLYRWQNELCESQEVVLLLKTRHELSAPLIGRITELHGYDTPCIVELPILGGQPAFLDWMDASLNHTGGDL
jgi:periplasmic divalent cation tolerance protein